MMDRRRLLLAIAAQSATWKDEAFSPLNGSLAPAKAKGPFKLGKLIGRTLAVNQCLNYSGITSFTTTNGISCTISNGTLHYQGTATASGYMGFISSGVVDQSTPSVQGHKYLISLNLTGSIGTGFFSCSALSGSPILKDGIYTASNSTFYGQFKMTSGETYDFYITPKIHDLTLMFGPGREPTTVDEFKQVYSRENTAYTEGRLESALVASIIAKPYNLFDGELFGGYWDANTGVKTINSAFVGSNDYIKVTQGKTYNLEIENNPNIYRNILGYDANKNFIRRFATPTSNSATITIPNDVRYITFYYTATQGDVCFHLTGTRTGYAPQKATTRLELPNDLTIKSALDAKDTFEVVPKTIGVLNNVSTLITSQTPNANGAVQISVSSLGVKPNTSYIVICNIRIDGFTTTTFSNAYNASIKESIGFVNNVLCIQSDSFIGKTATQIKALLAGKAFYYELETPRSDELAVFTKNVGTVDLGTLDGWTNYGTGGTTERVTTNALSSFVKNTQVNETANLMSSRITTVTYNSIYAGNNGIALNATSLYVKDTSIIGKTTNADIKAALSGIVANYELATPQTITIPMKKLQAVTIGELSWYNEELNGSAVAGLFRTNSLQGIIKGAADNYTIGNLYTSEILSGTWTQAYNLQNVIAINSSGAMRFIDTSCATVADFISKHRDDVIWFESVNDQPEWNSGTCDAGGEFETGYVSPDAVLKIYERK